MRHERDPVGGGPAVGGLQGHRPVPRQQDHRGGRRRLVRAPVRTHAGDHCRRERIRQVHVGTDHSGPPAVGIGHGPVPRPRPVRVPRRGLARLPARGSAGVPGPLRHLQPVLPHRPRAEGPGAEVQSGVQRQRRRGPDRGCAAGRRPQAAGRAGTLPPPAFGRRAAAGHAGPGLHDEAEAHRGRRTHLHDRRGAQGPVPQHSPRLQGSGHFLHLHHAQPGHRVLPGRPDHGHVPGADDRTRRHGPGGAPSVAPLYPAAD